MFATLSDRLTTTLRTLPGKTLTEADIDTTLRQIRLALLDADVAAPVVRDFTHAVREHLTGATRNKSLTPAEQVQVAVHSELVRILGGQHRPLNLDGRPAVVMLAGLQGAGKTTLAGKLAAHLKDQGHKVLLVAADLQRPSAVAQLRVLADRAEVDLYAPQTGVDTTGGIPGASTADPVTVARDGIAHARTGKHTVVIVDTAGRLGLDEQAIAEAAAIRAAVNPTETLFVIDAMTGQDAVSTARAFADGVGLTGVVLTKTDGDTRGGAALSVASVTGCPVLLVSTGEGMDDLEVFHPDRMASRILDLGDVDTLLERAHKTMDTDHSQSLAKRLAAGGSLTLEDFLVQLQGFRKMGPMSKVLGLLPGVGAMRDQIDNLDERQIDRVVAIVRSMTPAERTTPAIIDLSRKTRIARGSGTKVEDVDGLLERFVHAQQLTTQLLGQLTAGPATGRPIRPSATKKQPGKRKGKSGGRGKARSGNPAKRAEQLRALQGR